MKFYVASGFQNKANVQQVSEQLKKKGYTQTYDWTKNIRASTKKELEVIGEKELKAVRNADFLVVLLPGGKGTHIEMGIALGLSIPVYLYSEGNFPEASESTTFYYTTNVIRCSGSLSDLVDTILEKEK
ncbi:nucleoside 2-deoxyribosyltransferase [Bacillus sp. NTK071]|uniref:nucleoside 2-deoxyribosyltransferase n=1 Tax=Bacillus sp. NTK071 TaxID=2802175 RepID=UPI001A8F1022|nr:nucleoside 2-deoxyribosyltransferase [Bacillus sp. NTK071]MBN8210299.1 nucleoside 2-deoxyribosyltransferase [Bacillus sp. NTK071]